MPVWRLEQPQVVLLASENPHSHSVLRPSAELHYLSVAQFALRCFRFDPSHSVKWMGCPYVWPVVAVHTPMCFLRVPSLAGHQSPECVAPHLLWRFARSFEIHLQLLLRDACHGRMHSVADHLYCCTPVRDTSSGSPYIHQARLTHL